MPGVASAPGSTLTASPMMKSSPQRSRILRSSSAEKRIRPSKVPPQSSSRRFDHGAQNWSTTAW